MLKKITCLIARALHALGLLKSCKAPPLPKEVLQHQAKNSPKTTKKATKRKTTPKV
jgi:hypothetical protein